MRPDKWELHWPSDDELLGRAVMNAVRDTSPGFRWMRVRKAFSVGATLANALVERYVDDQGNLKL